MRMLTCRPVWGWTAPGRQTGTGGLYPWLTAPGSRGSDQRSSWSHQWSWSGGCRIEWSSQPRSPSDRTWSPGPPRWSQCTEKVHSMSFLASVFTLIRGLSTGFCLGYYGEQWALINTPSVSLSNQCIVLVIICELDSGIDFYLFYQLYHE